jgi:hypothetical protein
MDGPTWWHGSFSKSLHFYHEIWKMIVPHHKFRQNFQYIL